MERDRALNQSGYMGSLSGSQQQGRSTRYSPLIRTRRLQAIDGHQCEYNSGPRSDVLHADHKPSNATRDAKHLMLSHTGSQ